MATPEQQLPQPTDDALFQFCPETQGKCRGEECARWVSLLTGRGDGTRLEGCGPAVAAVALQNIYLVLLKQAGY